MDTTLQYIKMCETAEEIQKLMPRKDLVLASKFGAITVIDDLDFQDEEIYKRDTTVVVFLPRQDQLQQIMTDRENLKILNSSPYMQINRLHMLTHQMGKKYVEDYEAFLPKTHEQLWLCLVMKWSFNKEWNNKTISWETIKDIENVDEL